MSTLNYWEGRLREGQIFWAIEAFQPMFDYRRSDTDDKWPKEVASKALLKDYTLWAENQGIQPDEERIFYTVLSPYIYLEGRSQKRRRNHRITMQQSYKGTFVDVRKSRYFVVLYPLARHREAFRLRTGIET